MSNIEVDPFQSPGRRFSILPSSSPRHPNTPKTTAYTKLRAQHNALLEQFDALRVERDDLRQQLEQMTIECNRLKK